MYLVPLNEGRGRVSGNREAQLKKEDRRGGSAPHRSGEGNASKLACKRGGPGAPPDLFLESMPVRD